MHAADARQEAGFPAASTPGEGDADDRSVACVLLTNDPMDAKAALAAARLPAPHLSRDDIPHKAKRGNGPEPPAAAAPPRVGRCRRLWQFAGLHCRGGPRAGSMYLFISL
ncbi:hypothetical protein ACFC09_32635 [Streptomyces sp. NPDC056161]|uniref:hypothetical protein n=1 Tax=Streptomyces sp. NPDC056161 TaxID=3345732 RepID=UPI0035E159BA